MTACKVCSGPVEPWRIPYGHKGCRDCEIAHIQAHVINGTADWPDWNETEWLKADHHNQRQASEAVRAALADLRPDPWHWGQPGLAYGTDHPEPEWEANDPS